MVLLAALAASMTGLVLTPASAAVSNVGYTLSAGDPTLTTPLGDSSVTDCTAGVGAGAYPYQVRRLVVSAAGVYTVNDSGPGDGRIGIYDGAFDPADPQTGCVSFVDTNEGFELTAKTYTIVLSTATTGGVGAYSYSFDGPGTATVLAPTATTLTTSPNPSELSRATTLKATVAGGATPTGTVQFRDGATVLGSAALVGGTAQLVVRSLKVGTHTLGAIYSGDSTHEPSLDTHAHKVKYGPKPKVRLKVSDKTVAVGKKVKISWVTTGADSVKASGAWKGKKAKKGSVKVKIKKLGVHIFKLKVANVNGTAKAKAKVVAIRAPKNLAVDVPDDILTAGTKVRVRTSRLDAKERFKVFLDDELLGKGFADRRGVATLLALIPKDTKEGEHTLEVMGSNADRVGEIDVVVVAALKELEVDVELAKVKVNKTNTVSVTGLAAGEDVTVTYQGQTLVEGKAEDDGTFDYTFNVGTEAGEAILTVVGHVPGRNGDATFTVQPAKGPNVRAQMT
jgi:hypothetical protein